MDIVWFLIAGASSTTFILMLWYSICNHRTHMKRLDILDHAPAEYGDRYQRYMQQYGWVSYDDHFNCLFLFGNAKKLYGSMIQQAWDAPYDTTVPPPPAPEVLMEDTRSYLEVISNGP